MNLISTVYSEQRFLTIKVVMREHRNSFYNKLKNRI